MNPRLRTLLGDLSKRKIQSIFISSEENVSYLSGFKGMESYLFITPKHRFFLTDSRYMEQARKETRDFRMVLRDSKSYPDMIEILRKKSGCQYVGFEAGTIPHALYSSLSRALPGRSLVPLYDLVEQRRIIKDRGELQSLRKAVDITAMGIRYLRSTIQPGMTEKDIQAKVEYYTKMVGSEKPAFDIIVAAGVKSSMPHAISDSASRVKANDIVLIDMGVVSNGYHSDLTRCIFTGRMSPLMRRVYNTVLRAQERGIQKIRPGIQAQEVDSACRTYIHNSGYGKYFGHGTGHGVGLQIHEAPGISPRSRAILQAGMVITVEPGIYLPGRFGVRIEDMVLVTQKGHEVLTGNIEKQLPRSSQ